MKISNRAATAYETYLSKGCAPSAPKEIRDALLAMDNALNAYLDAVVEHEWACGYSYAMQRMEQSVERAWARGYSYAMQQMEQAHEG